MRGAWLDSFEFKEFEEDFEIRPDTLRRFGWRRIKRSTHSASPRLYYKHISLSIGLANQRINRTAWSGFGRLGCLLGYVGRVLGLLGGLLAPLEASRQPLGTLLARLGASWWPLGGHLVLFGDSWRPLGSS